MKKLYIPVLAGIILLLSSCSKETPTGPVQQARASVKITLWKQPFLAYSYTYGDVEIDYEISNVCQEYISQYEVIFQITCENGSTYEVRSGGISLAVDETKSGTARADTRGNKARSVEMSAVKCW